jgi:hypothetical protein
VGAGLQNVFQNEPREIVVFVVEKTRNCEGKGEVQTQQRRARLAFPWSLVVHAGHDGAREVKPVDQMQAAL